MGREEKGGEERGGNGKGRQGRVKTCCPIPNKLSPPICILQYNLVRSVHNFCYSSSLFAKDTNRPEQPETEFN